MSRISIKRMQSRLQSLIGIRGRLVLMALILVVPMMIDRVIVLEQTRAQQISGAADQLRVAARNSATAQREVASSIEALLRSSAYTYAIASQQGRGCAILRASMQVELPWVKSLSVGDANGTVVCSTIPSFAGKSIQDRAYFHRVVETHQFGLSDLIMGRGYNAVTVVGAYSTMAFEPANPAVIFASINLEWLAKSLLLDHISADGFLIDSAGTIIATHGGDVSKAGTPVGDKDTLAAIIRQEYGSLSLVDGEGNRTMIAVHRVPGTDWRVVVRANETTMLAAINGDIRRAYLQLALVVVLALSGAFVASERLIIRPVRLMTAMTQRFGSGDWSARVTRTNMPSEIMPLVRAFNVMASRLASRERELVASNDRLTVMASNDIVSGLANRRGFQSRLDFEWLKAEQTQDSLALLMIDVDHFKLFNDTYGHLEGDACLARVGEALAAVAFDCNGFAARYGGEEFCLLLPGANADRALLVGHMVKDRVEALAVEHTGSVFGRVTISSGIASTQPGVGQQTLDLIEAADAALYQAKSAGRNQVSAHGLICRLDNKLSLAS